MLLEDIHRELELPRFGLGAGCEVREEELADAFVLLRLLHQPCDQERKGSGKDWNRERIGIGKGSESGKDWNRERGGREKGGRTHLFVNRQHRVRLFPRLHAVVVDFGHEANVFVELGGEAAVGGGDVFDY